MGQTAIPCEDSFLLPMRLMAISNSILMIEKATTNRNRVKTVFFHFCERILLKPLKASPGQSGGTFPSLQGGLKFPFPRIFLSSFAFAPDFGRNLFPPGICLPPYDFTRIESGIERRVFRPFPSNLSFFAPSFSPDHHPSVASWGKRVPAPAPRFDLFRFHCYDRGVSCLPVCRSSFSLLVLRMARPDFLKRTRP
jgi:hypothetical protein